MLKAHRARQNETHLVLNQSCLILKFPFRPTVPAVCTCENTKSSSETLLSRLEQSWKQPLRKMQYLFYKLIKNPYHQGFVSFFFFLPPPAPAPFPISAKFDEKTSATTSSRRTFTSWSVRPILFFQPLPGQDQVTRLVD